MGKSRETANLVSDNSVFVDLGNNRVGINTNVPTKELDVVGDLKVSGNITGTFTGSIANAGTADTASFATTAFNLSGTGHTVSFATTAFGLDGNPIINISGENNSGVSTLTDLRLASIADKISIQSGTGVTLAYNSGEGNVVYMTSASGPIELNVTGIPTSSTFDSKALSFSIFVQQGTTAYACTSVTLNGLRFGADATAGFATHIAYPSGTVATGNTSCFDVFNFTGINTTGSASSITNYKLIGNVNGDYRLY
jgi:hypothetical protein|tara:strand:- start:190 stop:951 length:762 start_codon:yes stop_codon:yes gene_type:complete